MSNANKNTLNWIALVTILFPILLIIGLYMRVTQANGLVAERNWFYPMMTLHGVGMAGIWFMGAMACSWQMLSRHVKLNNTVSAIAFIGSVLGVLMLLASVIVGRFGAGWYFLYPLPFKGDWPLWSTAVFIGSLGVLGLSWLIWSLDMMIAIARKYSLPHALGWHYLIGKKEPYVPAGVSIVAITLIAVFACLISGVVIVVLFFADMLYGWGTDALLMKNITFFFGHLIVNLSLYLAVGVIYDTFPYYTKRPWKNNRVVAIAWNVVLLIVLAAYFHHLYMDFVQPTALQYIGQISSYLSAVPSGVVTIFGAWLLVYRAPVKWNLASTFFFLGLMGWAIGGIGAVIDSTIMVNIKFHNTLWVPAHFHTYMIEGLVLMVLGYFYHYCQVETRGAENLKIQKLAIILMLIGGYGFLAMFYLSGATSVPRRFAYYPDTVAQGAVYSSIAVAFGSLFLIGLLIYIGMVGRLWINARKGKIRDTGEESPASQPAPGEVH